MPTGHRLAAVDLGSNSFRLEIGHMDQGVFRRTEYLKETVRQGSGLDEDRNLTPQAMQAGWDCLARFGERLRGFQASEVRAVATQTLREARNRDVFLERANALLGFPIEVISGHEEARLIYQGVAQMLPTQQERRLVIDIGGRSTELIVGQGARATAMESYRVGSIAWSKRYFADQQFSPKAFEMAEIAAMAVLDPALDAFHRTHWDAAYGSAGTVGAIGDVLVAAGWPEGTITQEGLDWILERLVQARHVDNLHMAGMREDRKAIIGGGVSIMRAVFRLLDINTMSKAAGGLRHGLLCDIAGTTGYERDVQDASVQRLITKFAVEVSQAQRVSSVAAQLLNMWCKDDPQATSELAPQRSLQQAALLHEIGCHISHSDYHKHGAYILNNVDASGFSVPELHRVSQLVLGQRGKLRKVEAALQDPTLAAQLLCLRLALILCHARRDPDIEHVVLQRPQPETPLVELHLPLNWSARFPQTTFLLEEEAIAWKKADWALRLQQH